VAISEEIIPVSLLKYVVQHSTFQIRSPDTVNDTVTYSMTFGWQRCLGFLGILLVGVFIGSGKSLLPFVLEYIRHLAMRISRTFSP